VPKRWHSEQQEAGGTVACLDFLISYVLEAHPSLFAIGSVAWTFGGGETGNVADAG
jgi:hypothetical protein